tara:strand:- start:417 stop:587 length:171 start_codon:yes stop_codon:yes gene_type:complete
MTDNSDFKQIKENDLKDLDNICEECKKIDETVSQNLILNSFKVCDSCKTSKTLFPI